MIKRSRYSSDKSTAAQKSFYTYFGIRGESCSHSGEKWIGCQNLSCNIIHCWTKRRCFSSYLYILSPFFLERREFCRRKALKRNFNLLQKVSILMSSHMTEKPFLLSFYNLSWFIPVMKDFRFFPPHPSGNQQSITELFRGFYRAPHLHWGANS